CDPFPFDVEGNVADGEQRITFSGEQPAAFDEECQPVAFEDVEFDITFLRSTSPPPVVVGSIERAPASVNETEEREKARLTEVLAEKERETKRLDDLRAENDRSELALRQQLEAADHARREREKEETRLAELRKFSSQRDACRKFDIVACETALRSPHASAQD